MIIYILRCSCKQAKRACVSSKTLKKNIKNDSIGPFYSNERHPASVRVSADVQTYSITKQAGRKQPVSSQPRPCLVLDRICSKSKLHL